MPATVIVVADTTPLNYLIRLGLPEILKELYGRVLVPPAVLTEMRHMDAPPTVQVWAASPPEWLEQRAVSHLDTNLSKVLGIGERQAISLALELHADVLLIDDLPGRREAQGFHLVVAGTLAILLQASLRGYCNLPEAIKQLRHYGFWLSDAIEADTLDRYNRARQQK